MKNLTLGTFSTREDAEKSINRLHNELEISHDEISYVYRNTDGEEKEIDTEDVSSSTATEGAKDGAVIGGAVGALAGIAAVIGIVPIVGSIFVAGPLVAALGIGGALGTATAGAMTGAAAGGLIGALANLGVGQEKAQQYSDQVTAGNILVAVHSDENVDPKSILLDCGADNIETFRPRV